MTTMRTKLAQALPFAHLLGLGARAEDDDGTARRARRAEEDESDDKKKGKRADDDDDKKKEGRRAEDNGGDDGDDDDDSDAKAEEGGEDDDKDKKEGRRAKAKGGADDEDLDDEDDSDEEMRGNSASAKARRRERARCAAIFGSAAAGVRPDIAASLAFTTNMSRREAMSVLQTAAAGGAPARQAGLAERMSTANHENVKGDGGSSNPSGRSKVANAIIAAGEKARGK